MGKRQVKRKSAGRKSHVEAGEVFRQFAWNLAGTLVTRPTRSTRSEGKP